MITILSITPAGAADPIRFYSEVYEEAPLPSNGYHGFRHRFQHKSFGPPGGFTQAVESSCGVNSDGEDLFVTDNLAAAQFAEAGYAVEISAVYECGADGVYQRYTQARPTILGIPGVPHTMPFTDVDVEHEYGLIHNHSQGWTCGSLPDDNSWFFTLDGAKFSCAGYHPPNWETAPHAEWGVYSLETNSGVFSPIKYRHHYYSSMAFRNATSWVTTDYDSTVINGPTGGHGPATSQNWWHSCRNISPTCH